ncbi:MAG: hypothetical protein IT249_18740 [Chitinophagaceae bacterium]|nr:hypothetical protein [Chitinophagaceae bacterium]
MKTTNTINAFFWCVLLVVACKKERNDNSCSEKTNSIDIVKRILPASYSWDYSIVTYPGSNSFIETPASTGMNYKYVFNKNGTVSYYENQVLKTIDTYNIDYEFKISTYPADSSTVVSIIDKQTGQRKEFFRPYLCNDSALFYNPYNSIDTKRYFKRN